MSARLQADVGMQRLGRGAAWLLVGVGALLMLVPDGVWHRILPWF